MISYSERKIFTSYEVMLLRRAQVLVAAVDLGLPVLEEHELRCHELARVVGNILGLRVVDGRYGHVEHSWLVVPPREYTHMGSILDVYAPGQEPQVHLLDLFFGLGHVNVYQAGEPRTDIREDIVNAVEEHIRQGIPIW